MTPARWAGVIILAASLLYFAGVAVARALAFLDEVLWDGDTEDVLTVHDLAELGGWQV
jgi:hypothetical protein